MTPIARLLAAALVLCTTSLAAHAQTPAATPAPTTPVRIRGTIAGLDGNILSVTTREGPVVKVSLNDPLTVRTVKKLELTAITPGTYIGTAAEPGPGGELVALEVLVFPPAARGTAEGHNPWDLTPKSTMTNADVAAVAPVENGQLLTLTHKGGTTKVRVPAGVPIVTMAPAAREDLKPGQALIIFSAARAADGTLSTGSIVVAKDGVAPPM